MAHIVILGAGTGGMPAAYELRDELGTEHEVTVVNEREYFQFVPSNPWVAVGWRDRAGITFDIRPHLERKGINFIAKRCDGIDAENSVLELDGGETLSYDYLVITTGPRLAFDEVEGAGPDGGHTASVCTVAVPSAADSTSPFPTRCASRITGRRTRSTSAASTSTGSTSWATASRTCT